MKRNYITAGILIALIAVFAVSRTGHIGYPATNTFATSTSVATTTAEMPAQPQAEPALPLRTPTTTSSVQPVANNITLSVGDTSYGAYVTGSESVLTLMRTLASTTDFTFTGEEYPSLGFFVDSINGTENTGGHYWTLYINTAESQLGVSGARIQSGDTVEWRYQKGD